MKRIIITLLLVLAVTSLSFAEPIANQKKVNEIIAHIEQLENSDMSETESVKAANELAAKVVAISDSVVSDFTQAYQKALDNGVDMSGRAIPKEIAVESENFFTVFEILSLLAENVGMLSDDNIAGVSEAGNKFIDTINKMLAGSM